MADNNIIDIMKTRNSSRQLSYIHIPLNDRTLSFQNCILNYLDEYPNERFTLKFLMEELGILM